MALKTPADFGMLRCQFPYCPKTNIRSRLRPVKQSAYFLRPIICTGIYCTRGKLGRSFSSCFSRIFTQKDCFFALIFSTLMRCRLRAPHGPAFNSRFLVIARFVFPFLSVSSVITNLSARQPLPKINIVSSSLCIDYASPAINRSGEKRI